MKEITKEMINDLNINKLGYDQMGYNFKRIQDLSFHHTVVAKRNCKYLGFGDGYYYWNGSILVQKTSHDYLHLIEKYDKDRFYAITSELIDENMQRQILYNNLCYINSVLDSFEQEYCGQRIIKDEFTRRLMKK